MNKINRSFLCTVLVAVFLFSSYRSTRADTVDTAFNALVETTTYLNKDVWVLLPLQDGKVLAAGRFNRYNEVPVGNLIRLNADGSLDTQFNNGLIIDALDTVLTPLPSGKLILQGTFTLASGVQYNGATIRLNADGTLDSSFNYPFTRGKIRVDSLGRVLVGGNLQIVVNGTPTTKNLIRLNDDGSLDTTFDSPLIPEGLVDFAMQGTKAVYSVTTSIPPSTEAIGYLRRVNNDGSPDSTFPQTDLSNFGINGSLAVQPSGKILILTSRIYRANENGGIDTLFQGTTLQPPGSGLGSPSMLLNPDGRITVRIGGTSVVRLGVDGGSDSSWTTYDHVGPPFSTFGLNADGSVLLGDTALNSSSNRFWKLTSSGLLDMSFNPNGTGFQTIKSGTIRAITVQPDRKVLIGGDFDKVNGTIRRKLARLNEDSTLDASFHVDTGPSGDRFTAISDIYYVAIQTDGKLIVSGNFTYVVGSTQRGNLVRLNPNGSIDGTFIPVFTIQDYFPPSGLGRNRPLLLQTGQVLIGTSRVFPNTVAPLKLNANGSRDTSFNPAVQDVNGTLGIFDIAIQPNGKILVSGRYVEAVTSDNLGFIVRLNSNGTIDPTFSAADQRNLDVYAFSLLSNGKIVLAARGSQQSKIVRLNADGTLDATFYSGTGAPGKINALTVLSSGKIVLAGLFSSYQGETRQNFAVTDAEGHIDPFAVSLDKEVLCLTTDAEGRILLGGQFTSVSVGGKQFNRSYVARLIDDGGALNRTLFDYDGDRRADLSVRRPTDNIWYLLQGTAGFTAITWGQAGDRMAPADYDGDGKTDVAVFRPSTGQWFVVNSSNLTFTTYAWGQDGDLPVPTDRDNDGRADLVLYRASNNTWYPRSTATGPLTPTQFGEAGDKPMVGDFDADGIGDIAMFRPANNNWYIIKSSLGFFVQTWGEAGDIPTTGDFDGDGATDQAVFRPSTGQWFLSRTTAGFASQNWGQTGDIPVAADYDGDGKTDVAVFRPSNATWYIVQSTAGILILPFGQTGDVPTQSSYLY